MLNKKLIKDIQSLGLKKHRSETGLFVAEGPKIVKELAAVVPSAFESVYATAAWLRENPLEIACAEVSETELARISQLKTPNQVVAVMKQFSSEEPKEVKGICLYLDAIQDPGNFGTIIRIADWFGIGQIIASPGCADLYNPKVVQSTMASMARVRVWYDENQDFIEKSSVPMLAATLHGTPLPKIERPADCLLVIGNESKGIREELLKKAEQVTVPRIGEAESLNAAVATGIILSWLTLR